MKYIVKSPAKINICLLVNGTRDDGYHDLSMIMQKISLYDVMEFNICKKKYDSDEQQIKLFCDKAYIPVDDNNLIIKIVKYIYDLYGIKDNIKITLNKNIPICAGLGGGSSDAASTLLFLNEYYKLNICRSKLNDIAVSFGADIPFFLYGSESICRGKGEIITEIEPFNSYYILIATPNVKILTKDIFSQYDKISIDKMSSISLEKFNNVIYAIKKKNIDLLTKNMVNDLELVTCKNYNDVNEIKNIMLKCEANVSIMSGSGPTVYGIFDTFSKVKKCEETLKNAYSDIFLHICKPL